MRDVCFEAKSCTKVLTFLFRTFATWSRTSVPALGASTSGSTTRGARRARSSPSEAARATATGSAPGTSARVSASCTRSQKLGEAKAGSVEDEVVDEDGVSF